MNYRNVKDYPQLHSKTKSDYRPESRSECLCNAATQRNKITRDQPNGTRHLQYSIYIILEYYSRLYDYSIWIQQHLQYCSLSADA